MSDKNIPRHVAIIMDGNGRWAKERGLPRTAGHREGVKRVREIVKAASECGIEFLTLFAFSTENWKRPKREIDMLMRSLVIFLGQRINEMHRNNMRFKVIGREELLPLYVLERIKAAVRKTENNTGLTVILALNYGSRQEIIDAAGRMADLILSGKMNLGEQSEEIFSSLLYTAGLPDPDLLIRTSGEARLSNFMLWQLSYAELYFPKIYWPDFKSENFKKAIKAYAKRERRYGDINAS